MLWQFSFYVGWKDILNTSCGLKHWLPACLKAVNHFDHFEKAGYRQFGTTGQVVGYLLYCIMLFTITHGVTVTYKVTGVYHQRSPLIQGDME